MSVPVSLSCAAQDTGRGTGSTIQTRVDKKESFQQKVGLGFRLPVFVRPVIIPGTKRLEASAFCAPKKFFCLLGNQEIFQR